jgi:hypothetical protein
VIALALALVRRWPDVPSPEPARDPAREPTREELP